MTLKPSAENLFDGDDRAVLGLVWALMMKYLKFATEDDESMSPKVQLAAPLTSDLGWRLLAAPLTFDPGWRLLAAPLTSDPGWRCDVCVIVLPCPAR